MATAGTSRARAEPGRSPGEAGLGARRLAYAAIADVLGRRVALDDALDEHAARAGLDPRDEALARAIAVVAFRRFGTVRGALAERLARGLPADPGLVALLAAGAAQILFLDVPDHAAVDLAVRLAREEPQRRHQAGLVNAVLRRIARERDEILAASDPLDADTPAWLAERWRQRYGEDEARAIAQAHRGPAPIDLTVRADPAGWAERLQGVVLPTGSVRLSGREAVPTLPGYQEGAWWVQDAAAALPARLLAPRPGERVLDLCAAPGGKTAQIAAAGAAVVAVDRSEKRLRRLHDNLRRLGLAAETRVADALALGEDERFDAVLLDAPCSATGTIRRHPDVAWAKRAEDVARLAGLQARLLDKAASLVRPGGRLVVCTCSLEPEEGEALLAPLLARRPDLKRLPVTPDEVGDVAAFVSEQGDLRTLPHLWSERGGLDGFFAARLVRQG